LSQLQAPKTDVVSLDLVLSDPTIGGFESVVKLVDEPLSTVQKEIARFYKRKKRNDLLLLYFSGHGVLDLRGHLYLAVINTEHDLLSGTALPARFIRDEMAYSVAKNQVVILDCCHSGAFDHGKVAVGDSVGTEEVFGGSGHVVLTASDSLQVALDSSSISEVSANSVFTRYLIEGLETGYADLNTDGYITVDELYEFAYGKVIADETTSQTPMKIGKQKGQLMLAINPFAAERQQSFLSKQEQRAYEILRTAYDDWLTFDKQTHRLMDRGAVELVLRYVSKPTLPIHLTEYLICSIANLPRIPNSGIERLKDWLSEVEGATLQGLVQRLLDNEDKRTSEQVIGMFSVLGLQEAILPLMSVIQSEAGQRMKIESIKAVYGLGETIPENVAGSLIAGQNNWIIKSLALQSIDSIDRNSCLLVRDGSAFADELGDLVARAGFEVISTPDALATKEISRQGGYSFLQPFALVALVRGEHFSSIGGEEFYVTLRKYVARGGRLFATSWVSWETHHSTDRQAHFAAVLPFMHSVFSGHTSLDFLEDIPIDCQSTNSDLARTFFPERLSFRSSFEPLEAKENSTVLLETDNGIPVFGFHEFQEGICYYLNICQHSCISYMPSPLKSSPKLKVGLGRFFDWLHELVASQQIAGRFSAIR
jgi:hypothetical protein